MEGLPQADLDLAGLSLFSDLTASELEAVTQAFEANGFELVVSGEADWLVGGHRVDRAATTFGLPRKPVTLRRGDWFGELSLLFGEPSISDVYALTSMHLLVLPGHELEGFLRRYPKVMFALLKGEARRLRDPERWK